MWNAPVAVAADLSPVVRCLRHAVKCRPMAALLNIPLHITHVPSVCSCDILPSRAPGAPGAVLLSFQGGRTPLTAPANLSPLLKPRRRFPKALCVYYKGNQ